MEFPRSFFKNDPEVMGKLHQALVRNHRVAKHTKKVLFENRHVKDFCEMKTADKMISEVHNIDCMKFMATLPDKFFELAIVDPPYGIGQTWKKDRHSKFYTHESSYKNMNTPGADFFDELFRVSHNQIIWGANYYTQFLPARQGWIVWDKERRFEDSHLAEGELAWHSFNVPLRIVKNRWNGCLRSEERYGHHPHEKPTGLYKWLLKNYAKPGDKIFDSHMGSQSSRIAAYDMGFDYWGCELDKDYFESGCKRFEQFKSQLKLHFQNGPPDLERQQGSKSI